MRAEPESTVDVITRSIRLLAKQGYHATTVDQLAEAVGISRATFFRKYGSKEDMVFADHVSNLEHLDRLLCRPGLSPHAGLGEGVHLVFRHNLDHAERAVARHHLLQQVEGLRNRELATSHRYERLFQDYLRRVLPEGPDQRVTAVSLASATVAVHNAYLRTWLRDPRPSIGEQLSAELHQRIGWLCAGFGVAAPGARDVVPDQGAHATSTPPVVVVLHGGTDPASVADQAARSVYEALTGQSRPRSDFSTA